MTSAVHHLSCATMCPVAGSLFGGQMCAHCLLVETPRDGLVLVDTGFGMRDCSGEQPMSKMFKTFVRPTLAPAETAFAQVAALGYTPADVRHIVVTHLDVDHAGGLADFPDAKVHLHAREHDAAMARSTRKERERYVPGHWAHGPKWETYAESGDTWRGLPAVTKLRGVEADIGLLPMHGHTRGHSAVLVGTGARWLVHAGDAYFGRGSVEDGLKLPIGLRMFERAMQIDGRARKSSVAALRELRASYDDVDLFCAHDPNELAALQARRASAAA